MLYCTLHAWYRDDIYLHHRGDDAPTHALKEVILQQVEMNALSKVRRSYFIYAA